MSNPMTPERLGTVVAELLESAVFIFAEDAAITPWDASVLWSAHLEMEHEEKVDLALCVPKELGLTLAANLLGLEPDEEDAKQGLCDAVGEMANMLAGILAVDLFGGDVVCRISVPQTAEETGAEHDAHAAKAFCRVALKTEDGQRLDACLTKVGQELKAPGPRLTGKTPTPTGDCP
jgi:hypothetical protein